MSLDTAAPHTHKSPLHRAVQCSSLQRKKNALDAASVENDARSTKSRATAGVRSREIGCPDPRQGVLRNYNLEAPSPLRP